MDIEKLNLRKFLVKSVANDKKTLQGKDLYDNIEKTVHIPVYTRMHFSYYQVNTIIYAHRGEPGTNIWYLVTETNFKMHPALAKNLAKVDEYFARLEI